MNFDKIWWKHGFHQISSNFIKVHQKNQGFEKKTELWWNLMKTWFFIKFLQNSSKKSRFWKKIDFDEIWWNLMKTSNFIKFHQKNQGFEKKMNFDEIWWKPGFSSNFIKFHQGSSKFIKTKFIWKNATTSDWNQI